MKKNKIRLWKEAILNVMNAENITVLKKKH